MKIKNGVGETEWYYQSFSSVGIGWFWALRLWSWLHKFLRRQRQWWSWCDLYIMSSTHPTVMSKMLLPTELDTAMSPSPFLGGRWATMTLGDQVRDWSPSGQDSQTHDLFTTYANCLSNLKPWQGQTEECLKSQNHEDHQHFNAAPLLMNSYSVLCWVWR